MTGPVIPGGERQRLRHFILDGFASTERFRSPGGGGAKTAPARSRAAHGGALLRQLEKLGARADDRATESELEAGLQLEFSGFADVELAFESLARERSGIELLNVRREGDATHATVFVPDGKLAHFEKLVREYLSEKRGAKNQLLDHRALIDTIKEIRKASLRALWTDDPTVFPSEDNLPFWWEVWLPVRGDRDGVIHAFRSTAEAEGMRVAAGEVRFLERTVLLAFATPEQMRRSAALINVIAELRRAKETAEFFDGLPPSEQAEWLQELLGRTDFAELGSSVPYVCILDTGVNNGHELLAPALDSTDLHTNEPSWDTNDEEGHGTEMAGLALLGDVTTLLAATGVVSVRRRLESVKLLRNDGDNGTDAQHHAYLMTEAIARPEVTAPDRARVFTMAITSRDNRDRGRPSAWSAAVDSLCADADGDGAVPRLIVVSAGNVDDIAAWNAYPDSNSSDGIHDPGQAWNAVTVGACTELVNITDAEAEGYQPVAGAGGISPFSTTSSTWQAQWPLKPDIMLEGGNAGRDRHGAVWMPSLSLLTTHHRPLQRSFTTTRATSAATALASGMAAELMAEYPELRPESIRGLLVHSAMWTKEMRRMYLPHGRDPSKADYARLLRHCGFGVPKLSRAKWSASNSLSMIVEEELQPFVRNGSATPTLRDMQLHKLPWPLGELEALGETLVEMRVTLSYFIEPNPSARGRSRYRYESHGLRFEVKRPTESLAGFRARINRAARDEEEGIQSSGDDAQWLIGKNVRHRGSIHCDIWRGAAADLASRGVVAVYPALGWWKTRTALERYGKTAPYSLIVSIRAPRIAVDLYSAVAAEIETRVAVEL